MLTILKKDKAITHNFILKIHLCLVMHDFINSSLYNYTILCNF